MIGFSTFYTWRFIIFSLKNFGLSLSFAANAFVLLLLTSVEIARKFSTMAGFLCLRLADRRTCFWDIWILIDV